MKKLLPGIFILGWMLLLLSAGCSGDSDSDPTPNQPPIITPAGKKPPVANAGEDVTIYLPKDSVVLDGTGTDADGRIEKYEWTKLTGPASYNLTNATAANARVGKLVEGVYEFQLKVTDNDGLSAQDSKKVTVGPPCDCAPNCDDIGDPCDPWDY